MRDYLDGRENVRYCPIQSLYPAHYRDDGICKCEYPAREARAWQIKLEDERPEAGNTPSQTSGRPR